MEYPDIIYTKEDHIATVTLNRPERMNAFSGAMIDSIIRAFENAAAADEIRVIVVTGAGRAFSAGLDLKEPPNFRANLSGGATVQVPPLAAVAISMDKPIIASINGPAIGWGLEVAMLCDIRVAVENARIGDRHVNYCVISDHGGLFLLPRLVGWAKACELAFTGQFIDGKEAARIGLVNKAVPQEQLEATVREMANSIASQPPLALQLAKRAMRDGLASDFKTSQDYAFALLGQLVRSEDFGEAMRALRENREPQFKGR